MRIAIFASSFYPHTGGVEELTRQLAHAYHEAGHDAIVLTNRWPPGLAAQTNCEGIATYRYPMRIFQGPYRAKLRFALTHKRIERSISKVLVRHRIDVIHVQCVSTNGFYALRAARHLGLPLVVTAQGELTMDADRAYERPGGLNDVLAELLEHADHVTGCSQYVLECLLAHRGRPFVQPTSVIFNGVTLTDFDGPSVVPHKHKAPYILGIGRWVPQKGFDVLIRAFARAARRPEFKHDLLLAGTGPEESHLGRIIAEEGLTDRAVLLGRADRRLATSLFAGCSFFVLPSRIEPFGIVNLEAMAARKPVIATSVGGVSEIVDHAGTGILVPPEDVESLASAMGHLSEDAAARERLAAAGRQFASAFDWHLIADRYIQLYRDVSGGVNYQ